MKNPFKHRYVQHLFKSWRHHFSLQMATMVVLIASFTVVSGVLTLQKNLNHILTMWGESMQVSVYLTENASDDEVDGIRHFLEGHKDIAKPKMITKKDALQIFQEQMASFAPEILKDPELIKYIPSSFQFALNSKIQPQDQYDKMKEIYGELKTVSGVDDINYGQDWIKSYSSITKAINASGMAFILLLLAAATFVMANSIHSALNQRRTEIEVLELVGATASFVRAPYIFEGAFLGLIAALVSTTFCYGIFEAGRETFKGELSLLQLSSHLRFLTEGQVGLIMLMGTLIGAAASWICVRRINSGSAASANSRSV